MEMIPKMSGVGLDVFEGDVITVIDSQGEQVSDLFCVSSHDPSDYFSAGRTIDYNEKMKMGVEDILYSSKSLPMLKIIEDDVEDHDITLTPCSTHTFQNLYDPPFSRPGCEGNIIKAFKNLGLEYASIPSTFNIFMNVDFLGSKGEITIGPPKSKPGDKIKLLALMDLKVALTACSAPNSNNGICKPIGYQLERKKTKAPL